MSRITTVEERKCIATIAFSIGIFLGFAVLIAAYANNTSNYTSNKFVTVDDFIRNKTIKNVVFNSKSDMVIEFENTNHQLWIFAYCERHYCVDTYLNLPINNFNSIIHKKITNVTFSDIFIRKHINLTNIHGRTISINFDDQTKFQLESNIVVDLRSLYFDEERYPDRLEFRRGIVRKRIILDGNIVI